ncbi:MAG: hypothetical protein V3V08_04405 [Nannocystaceae bacterium]
MSDLLRIDVDAELRKVTAGQLMGAWQIPAELVRRGIGAGATSIDVEFGYKRVTVRDNARTISGVALGDLARLLDRSQTSHQRHGALARLESAQESALISVAGLALKRLCVMIHGPARSWVLRYDRGRISLAHMPARGSHGTEISVVAVDVGGTRAKNWIAHACAFAPVQVRVGGRALPPAFSGALFTGPLHTPFEGRFAVPPDGEVARAWLLVDGVISTHVCISPAPTFEAALELGRHTTPGASPADLRARLQPALSLLVGKVFDYLIDLARRSPKLPPPLRTRVTQLLLQTVVRHGKVGAIEKLPMFPAFDRHQGHQWYDLASIRELASRRSDRLSILAPTETPDLYAFEGPCLLLGDVERALLSELLHVRVETPRPQTYRGTWSTRAGAAIVSAGDWVWANIIGLLSPTPRAILPARLQPEESNFLAALREQLELTPTPFDVCLCAGSAAIRRIRNTLWLPRQNAHVRASVFAVARDPNWVYPAALALLGDRVILPSARRLRWLQSVASST